MKNMVVLLLISMVMLLSGWATEDIETDIEKINVKLSEDEIAITFLDIPNGEATLLHFPNEEFILVNTGGRRTETELKEYLNIYGVKKLKAIIVTKDEPLYTSNLKWLLARYKDAKLIAGENSLISQILTEKEIEKWKVGNEYKFGELDIHVIHEEVNEDHSLGMDLLFRFGNNQILYMTSSDNALEHELLNNKKLPSTNIIKVADFGDSRGTGEKFIEYVNPQIAIIYHKRGLLPSQDVLERLNNTWIDIYYTKQFGSVTIKLTPSDYEVITIPLKSNKPQIEPS